MQFAGNRIKREWKRKTSSSPNNKRKNQPNIHFFINLISNLRKSMEHKNNASERKINNKWNNLKYCLLLLYLNKVSNGVKRKLSPRDIAVRA
jgi:hypothetical protein